MKKYLFCIIILSTVASIVGCSGGGGGTPGDSGLNFQEGLPPNDISGCFNATFTIIKNTCNLPSGELTRSICIEQDGSKATITMRSDSGASVPAEQTSDKQTGSVDDPALYIRERVATLSTYSGTVSGSSFKSEKPGSFSDESCAMTSKETFIGTISGDSITGNTQGTMTATGSCDKVPPGTCDVAATYSGTKTSKPQTTVPVTGTTTVPNSEGLTPGSSVDYAAPLPKEDK